MCITVLINWGSSFSCYRLPETMPLYDILNEFQKGHSHMAVVVRQCNKAVEESSSDPPESRPTSYLTCLKKLL